ncbi:hypothetical protein [Streptomyces sp. NPDC056061]|uniref:hypothetical protein n=1 Tax=Streptomyces sp. NPDC056061 TaxID=3345700 RepID=UPI0035D7C711
MQEHNWYYDNGEELMGVPAAEEAEHWMAVERIHGLARQGFNPADWDTRFRREVARCGLPRFACA